MAPRDPVISEEEIARFAREVVHNIALYGAVDEARAREIYQQSIIPEGLAEAPDYYLHESPYYWAMYLLTGSRNTTQTPPSDAIPGSVVPPYTELTWDQVQQLMGVSALPNRSINWRGQAECPRIAWIITDLDGPRNQLERPDRLAGETFCLSDEKVDAAAKRMLTSPCQFPLHIFRRLGGKPVRYTYLGLGKVAGYDGGPAYPHWKILLQPIEAGGMVQSG